MKTYVVNTHYKHLTEDIVINKRDTRKYFSDFAANTHIVCVDLPQYGASNDYPTPIFVEKLETN